MPKGRIGLSLSEDVLAILNEHGRCEFDPDKDDKDAGCTRCGKMWDHENHSPLLPTRTEIIEAAVREWDPMNTFLARRSPAEPNVSPATVAMLDEMHRQIDRERNSLSPESKQKRNVVKAEKRERKAELADAISR